MGLKDKHCSACTRTTPRLDAGTIGLIKPEIPDWTVADERLKRRFAFADFKGALAFVNRVGEVAEAEQHHPDLTIHYNQVDVDIWTHAIEPPGLTENDFILAARIDSLG